MQAVSIEAILLLVVSVCVFAVLRIAWDFRAAVANIQNHQGYRVLLNPFGYLGNILPEIKGIARGRNELFSNKHRSFERADCDILSVVSALPKVQTQLLLADAAAIKEVTSSRYRYPKPAHLYTILLSFGANIVASEGEEWKRFRKITAPAFSDRNNQLVWDETSLIMLDLFNNVWRDQAEIAVDHCVDITLQIALSVITVAGFGRKVSWLEDQTIPAGHQMTFKDALHIVSNDAKIRLLVPGWAMMLTPRLRKIRLAFKEFQQYTAELIEDRKTSEKNGRHDLFSTLLSEKDDVDKLSTTELFANIFIFQLAGHETTAHTLCFTFALLALYPDEQEILFQQIKGLLSGDRLPTYAEMPRFTYSMAVFYETLRMFPPVVGVPKISAQDNILTTGNAAGEIKSIPVPKGTYVTLDIPALHFNSRYWKDPHSFKPSRFLEDWPRDAFMPFSAGARACLGRKFFETEGIAILTMLVSRYKIEVKDEPQFAHETFEEKKARILEARPGITLTPVRVPLVFKRR